jgi:hypothetical protein
MSTEFLTALNTSSGTPFRRITFVPAVRPDAHSSQSSLVLVPLNDPVEVSPPGIFVGFIENNLCHLYSPCCSVQRLLSQRPCDMVSNHATPEDLQMFCLNHDLILADGCHVAFGQCLRCEGRETA